jgi:hypothetical protein
MNKILILTLALAAIALADVLVDTDRDGIADYRVATRPETVAVRADWNRDGVIDWQDEWVVRPGWRGAYDWNGDGIIDWRDDWHVAGARPWTGDWVRADWNRDGVLDWQDGWRRLDNSWAAGSWDPLWRGEGWRPETVSVREIPSGTYPDTEWRTVEGPWDTWGWGGSWVGDWNGDGIVDWRDDWAWRDHFYGEPAGWRNGWVEDFRAAPGGVRVREVPAGSTRTVTTTPSTRTTTKPTTTTTKTTTTKPATTTTTKPAASTTTTKPATSSRR